MSKAWAGVLLMSAALAAPMRVQARAETPQTPTIAEKTKDAQKLPGYFNLYWDAKQGKLWLEIDKWSTEFLYQSSLPAGIGSNDIGLDRGQLGATRVVRFERSGPKVLLVQENLDFRSEEHTSELQSRVDLVCRLLLEKKKKKKKLHQK